MVVASSNWSTEDHMMLLRCVCDSLNVDTLGGVLDQLDIASLALPMGTEQLRILYYG